jgi:hypothetical protein
MKQSRKSLLLERRKKPKSQARNQRERARLKLPRCKQVRDVLQIGHFSEGAHSASSQMRRTMMMTTTTMKTMRKTKKKTTM